MITPNRVHCTQPFSTHANTCRHIQTYHPLAIVSFPLDDKKLQLHIMASELDPRHRINLCFADF
jgi:hypothetical protein